MTHRSWHVQWGALMLVLLGNALLGGCKHDTPSATSATSETGETGFPLDSCEDNEDCADPWQPICVNGFCSPCTSNMECTDGNYPMCIDGACAKACVSNDSKESNDNSMEAKVVADGSDFDLNLCNEAGMYHDTEDWFYFTLNGAAYLSIITNNDPHDGDFDLTLFDSGLSVVDSSSSVFYGAHVPRNVEAVHTRVPSGTYYFRLRMTDGAGDVPYRLVVQILPEG